MEKELQEIRERLAQVDEWKQRREAIENELAAVWTDQADAPLEAPDYVAGEPKNDAPSDAPAAAPTAAAPDTLTPTATAGAAGDVEEKAVAAEAEKPKKKKKTFLKK